MFTIINNWSQGPLNFDSLEKRFYNNLILLIIRVATILLSSCLDYGDHPDPQDSILRYQASIEARCFKNMEEARNLWEKVMSRHGREAEFWLEYAQLERYIGR